MNSAPSFVYATYIRSSPERVWKALTDSGLTAQWHRSGSDWQNGSAWEHRRIDGSDIVDVVGSFVESDPPRRLVLTFGAPGDGAPQSPSVTFAIERYHEVVRLTVTHEDLPDEAGGNETAVGLPPVLANLESVLELGRTRSQAPSKMDAEPSGTARR
jgi:uncharacterized protein YndB with AHSA1/START domain